jgi:hypothetical protein
MRFSESLASLHQPTHLGHVLFAVMLGMTLHCVLLPSGQFFGTVCHAKKKKAPPNGRAINRYQEGIAVVSSGVFTINSTIGIRSMS